VFFVTAEHAYIVPTAGTLENQTKIRDEESTTAAALQPPRGRDHAQSRWHDFWI